VKNITVSIDDETHRLARIYAAKRGFSISAVVKTQLQKLAAEASAFEASVKPGLDPSSDEYKRIKLLGEAAMDRVGEGFSASNRLSREELYAERFQRKST
jgi:hypothetical protein